MIAIKIGTTSYRQTQTLAGDEVEFTGEYLFEADGITPAMVWDNTLQNVRPMVAADYVAKAAAQLVLDRAAAVQEVDRRIQKAGWLVTMDENNLQSDKINEILTAIKGAATFAAMKTAVTAIVNFPQRNETQVRNAIINKIQSGAAD